MRHATRVHHYRRIESPSAGGLLPGRRPGWAECRHFLTVLSSLRPPGAGRRMGRRPQCKVSLSAAPVYGHSSRRARARTYHREPASSGLRRDATYTSAADDLRWPGIDASQSRPQLEPRPNSSAPNEDMTADALGGFLAPSPSIGWLPPSADAAARRIQRSDITLFTHISPGRHTRATSAIFHSARY